MNRTNEELLALAYAAARDEANRRMRAAGRTAWSESDYNAAVRLFHTLCPETEQETA